MAYRDKGDDPLTETCSLSNRVTTFEGNLDSLQASGGADTPEDVISGIEELQKLNWREYATKVIIHVADAPCHGSKYHDEHDSYGGGDYKGRSLL